MTTDFKSIYVFVLLKCCSMSCVYDSYVGQVYSGIQWIPFIASLAISVAAWGVSPRGTNGTVKPAKQLILLLFAIWLLVMEFFLYVLQVFFDRQRADPFCYNVFYYVFPSRITFYLAVLVTYLFMFAMLWDAELHWIYWTCVFLFFVGPQSMLLWMTYNTWQESLVSTIFGSVSTIFFMVVYRYVLMDYAPYLVNQRPWTWFSAADSWAMDETRLRRSLLIKRTLESLRQFDLQ